MSRANTMVDPLSTAASVASLITIAAQVGVLIQGCISRVRTADGTLRSFQSELRLLVKYLEAIEGVLGCANLRDAFRRVASSSQMNAQLSSLDAILGESRATLQELDSLLREINRGGRLASGLLHKPAVAWRLNSSSPELGNIQKLVKTYNGAIQIHLLLLNLLINIENTPAMQSIDQSLSEIRDQILRLRFTSHHVAESAPTGHPDTIMQSLHASESIFSSASEYLGSTAGTIPDNITITADGGGAEQVAAWLAESHDDDLDALLLSNLAVIAEEHFDRREFADARRFFTKFIEKAQTVDRYTSDLTGAQLKLAYSCQLTEHYEEAKDALFAIDIAHCSPEQALERKQSLAEAFLALNSNLDDAKQHMREVMQGRSKIADLSAYSYSLTLLTRICNQMGDDEEAMAYQRSLSLNSAAILRTSGTLERELDASMPSSTDPSDVYSSVGSQKTPNSSLSSEYVKAPTNIHSFAISPDGFQIITCELNSRIATIWDVKPFRRTVALQRSGSASIRSVAWSNEGSRIAIAEVQQIYVWDSRSFELVATLAQTSRSSAVLSPSQWFSRPKPEIELIRFSKDASYLWSRERNPKDITIWNVATRKIKLKVGSYCKDVSLLYFKPDAPTRISAIKASGTIVEMDLQRIRPRLLHEQHVSPPLIRYMNFSADGRIALVVHDEGSATGSVHIVHIGKGFGESSRRRLPWTTGESGWALFLTEYRILSGGRRDKCSIWDLSIGIEGEQIHTFQDMDVDVSNQPQLSRDKRTFMYITPERTVRVVDVSEWVGDS